LALLRHVVLADQLDCLDLLGSDDDVDVVDEEEAAGGNP
jgi:hypothetical protein